MQMKLSLLVLWIDSLHPLPRSRMACGAFSFGSTSINYRFSATGKVLGAILVRRTLATEAQVLPRGTRRTPTASQAWPDFHQGSEDPMIRKLLLTSTATVL